VQLTRHRRLTMITVSLNAGEAVTTIGLSNVE
jgi:hypothetical protein